MKSLCQLENKILTVITQNRLILKNQTVLLAYSGGADSTALLIILKKLSEIIDFKLYALHINHMLRGADAYEDESKCIKTCSKWDIKCFTKRVDVTRYAEENNLSIEQAGREIRYRELFLLKGELKAHSIATAHHYDDNIETIIMRIIRGTGIDGLCGIDIKRNDGIIRPFLSVKKSEILGYLKKNNIAYCVDKTNFENFYFRNKIRNIILPAFLNINADFENIIYRLSRQSKILKEKIESELNEYKSQIIVEEKSAKIKIELLYGAKDYLKPYIIRQMLNCIGSLADIEKKNIESILSLPASNTVWSVDWPRGIKAKREYEYLIVTNCINNDAEDNKNFNFVLKFNEENIISPLGIKIMMEHTDTFEKKYSSSFQKYIDYDKIKGNVFIRSRKTGDVIKPLNMKGSVSLKKYFINNKIPKQQRDNIPLLCDKDNIIWVIGYALNDAYKIDKNTKNIIKITVTDMERDNA